MRRLAILLALILVPVLTMPAHSQAQTRHPRAPKPHKWAVVLHGGAGVIKRSSMSPQIEKQYRDGLRQAITAAGAVLDKGGSALDAVQAAIEILEDNPLFNAGRGAVFAADGTNQMDASIMDGATMKAGAVADVQHTRHPIALARAVMEKTPFVLLSGTGADAFSVHAGLQQEPRSYFFTESRWQALIKELKKENLPIPPRPRGVPPPPASGRARARLGDGYIELPDNHNYGTVGVVALDQHGNVAAGTSTGGLTAKRWDRIGDSPSSEPEPTPPTNPAPSPEPASENTSSATPSPAPSAPWSNTNTCACKPPPTRLSRNNSPPSTEKAASSPSPPTANSPGASTPPACSAPN